MLCLSPSYLTLSERSIVEESIERSIVEDKIDSSTSSPIFLSSNVVLFLGTGNKCPYLKHPLPSQQLCPKDVTLALLFYISSYLSKLRCLHVLPCDVALSPPLKHTLALRTEHRTSASHLDTMVTITRFSDCGFAPHHGVSDLALETVLGPEKSTMLNSGTDGAGATEIFRRHGDELYDPFVAENEGEGEATDVLHSRPLRVGMLCADNGDGCVGAAFISRFRRAGMVRSAGRDVFIFATVYVGL